MHIIPTLTLPLEPTPPILLANEQPVNQPHKLPIVPLNFPQTAVNKHFSLIEYLNPRIIISNETKARIS